MSGWFVTTTSSHPASARRRHASSTPGSRTTSAAPAGGRAAVAHHRRALSTPSRSRNTARRARRAHHSRPARRRRASTASTARSAVAGAVAVLPAERADAIGGDAHDRHVALPAAVATACTRARPIAGSRPRHSIASSAISAHRDVVAGGDVEHRERLCASVAGERAPRRARRRRGRTTCSACRRRGSRAGSGRRAACARSRSRRRGSGSGPTTLPKRNARPRQPNMWQYDAISASPASLLAP